MLVIKEDEKAIVFTFSSEERQVQCVADTAEKYLKRYGIEDCYRLKLVTRELVLNGHSARQQKQPRASDNVPR